MLKLEEFRIVSIKDASKTLGGWFDTCTDDNCVNHHDYTTSLPNGSTNTDEAGPVSNDDCLPVAGGGM